MVIVIVTPILLLLIIIIIIVIVAYVLISLVFLINVGPLQVNRGQVTFDSEGNDYPNSRYFSRKPHVPSSNSGVTLGRGYDLKEKKSSKVLSDLRSVGIDFKIAKTFSRAVGLKGLNAKNFIKVSHYFTIMFLYN